MKKAFIWLLVIVLIIVGSVWGTLAYLTDKETKTNTMTIGNVDIELLEYERIGLETKNKDAAVRPFTQGTPLYPAVTEDDFDYSKYNAYVDWEQIGKSGYQSDIWDPAKINNELDKMVFVKNTGDNSTYVRVFFAFEAGAYTNFGQFEKKVHLNLNDEDWTWKWEPYIAKIGNEKFFIATATYEHILEPGALTEISLSQISLDPTATNADVKAFNGEYNVPIFAQAIQTASFSDPKTALVTGFGNDIPFEGITFDKGVTLKTAFTYLEGNTAGTNIYNNVENIIFGTKDAYPEVKSSYSGTLTSNDQGAPTHTYYVPSKTTEGNYDLYVLADEGKVYAPESCEDLFRGMTNLTSVAGKAFDVSHTTDMSNMFYNCKKLQTVDTSSWDVSKVTNMTHLFRFCYELKELDVSNWDVGNVTSMSFMFHSCYDLENIDVSNWNVSALVDMLCIFEACRTFTSLDVSNWNTQSVTNARCAFKGCSNLQTIDVSGWNVDNVTDMSSMFQGCGNLSSPMNLSTWNVSKVTDMEYLFSGCGNIPSLNVSGWNVAKVTNFTSVFSSCGLLTELAVENWDVSAATSMQGMFSDCSGLTSLNLSAWGDKLNGVTNMHKMFWGCSLLTSLNVSTWDVSTVTNMYGMFRLCSSLNPLDISDWDVTSLTNATEMFTECSSLTQLDLSGWDTENLESTESMFRYCSNLTTIYVSETWKMNKVTGSDHMFDSCSNLIGGKGTKFVFNITDKTYARIDCGKDGTDTLSPGYMTYKSADSTNS